MTQDRPIENLHSLLRELCKLPNETEWVEFKRNNKDPKEIGEYISALANSAALYGKLHAYVVWGVRDEDHAVVGTTFKPSQTKQGNEELESWLLRLLNPKLLFRFHEFEYDDKSVVILEIHQAIHTPVQFEGREYIRIGSYKKPLKDFQAKERELWRVFDQVPFERQLAVEDVSAEQVLKLLNYPAYFDLMDMPLPENRDGILTRLSDDALIVKNDAGSWDISNLGAVLFAYKLQSFPRLGRKAVRLILYKGKSRGETVREQEGNKGYAVGFEGLIDYIKTLVPENEVIGQALRKSVPMYPELAIRELVANAIIHQDFTISGTGPMIEIFEDRMEITNPGKPLVDTQRFIDTPPQSRNEALASMLRRIGVCEERGTGVDKVMIQVELFQLPAPLFEAYPEHTRVVLFAHREFKDMDKEDRIRACYMHCVLKYVNREMMNNATLRDRFGVEVKNSAMMSRIIKQACQAGLIKPYDADAGTKALRYVPYWA